MHGLLSVWISSPFKARNNPPCDRPHCLLNISDGHLNCSQVPCLSSSRVFCAAGPVGLGMPLAPWSVACGHHAQPSCHWCSLVLSSPNRAGGSSLPPSQHPCRPAAWWYHLVHLSTRPGITSPAAVAPLTPTWSCNYKAGQASGPQHNCWGSPVSPVHSHLPSPLPAPFILLEAFSTLGGKHGVKGIHAYEPKLRSENTSISECARK